MKIIVAWLVASAALFAPAHADAGDPLRFAQWGLTQVHAPDAWSATKGAGAIVAVIDAGGVDFSHPDLAGKKAGGVKFSACGPIGCGSGDWVPGAGPHATWVAGVIAATEGNDVGIAGVAPAVKLLSIDVGPSIFISDVALAITWAISHGADVINLSFGRAGLYGTMLLGEPNDMRDALHDAFEAGVPVIAAAGNHSYPFSLVAPPGDYPHVPVLCADPASQPDVICVSATDKREIPSVVYTGLPVREDLNAVAAPGGLGLGATLSGESCAEAIITTHPIGLPAMCPTPDGYEAVDGTSFAAPHVTGVAALLASLGCDYGAIREILTGTARTPVAGVRGTYTPLWGHGIVDASAAVTAASTAC